mmetsp:Transcript_355/g.1189  ORF Transcript_355/g.1189 Transcript_355/m.1189 type:complete len:84 (-) Transcript_355:716-967(-)
MLSVIEFFQTISPNFKVQFVIASAKNQFTVSAPNLLVRASTASFRNGTFRSSKILKNSLMQAFFCPAAAEQSQNCHYRSSMPI